MRAVAVGAVAVCVLAGTRLVAFAQDRPFTECYIADMRLKAGSDSAFSNSVSLVRRKFNPAKGTVEEDIINMDARNNTLQMKASWHVKDNKAEVTEAAGAFTGSYTLTGEAWAWEKLEGELVMKTGTKIKETSEKAPFGMTVSRVYSAESGRVIATTTERHYLLSEEAFEILKARIVKQP